MFAEERYKKLQWLCRRGMKELDVLLERFVHVERAALLNGVWPEFEGLLALEDDTLWDWLQDPSRADADEYRELLQRIRDARG